MNTSLYIIASVVLVSIVSLSGVALLALNEKRLGQSLLLLVSFAVGALFANVFFHLLPELAEESSDFTVSFGLVLLGLVLSFVLEKFIHWHHHSIDPKHISEHHHSPVGKLLLIGDGLHNVTDGMLIATAYLVNVPLGIATTIAVMLHEIPQEMGDFAVLLHSGYTRSRALLFNFISALTAVAGAVAVLFLDQYLDGIEFFLLPLVAGNFLYIAGTDLIPVLHHERRVSQVVMQLAAMLAGIALLWSLTLAEPPHSQESTEPWQGTESL